MTDKVVLDDSEHYTEFETLLKKLKEAKQTQDSEV